MRPTIDSIVKSFQNSGKRHFLITGNRGIGKTTLFLKLRELLCSKESNIIPGIKTYAVPQEKVMLQNELTGEEAEIGVFRNSWMETVSSGFQNLGVKCVKEALDLEAEWFTMDEIGFLESKEEDFKDILYRMFDTKRVLAVIRKQDIEFLNSLKNREDVYLIDMDEMRLHVGCVVMASGISKRFGENKLLVDLGGETLIERVLKLTDGPVFARRIVVTRTKEVEELCKSKGIDVILHDFPGRGDAVRLGMEQMMDLDGCMFCPCDQPFLLEKSLNRMVGKFTYGEKTIFKLGFEEKHGAPVLFSKEYFEELCNLPEKSGGSYIMKRYPEEVDIISAESEKELWDMDTKDDYERMRCSMGRKKYKRIFAIVIDSLGVGAMEDAGDYGDNGADTLGHIAKKVTGLQIPNLRNLGIANICNLENILPVEQPLGYHTKLREASNGKDTMTGHWEMMGLLITTPFQTFTENGFPKELIDELSRRTGRVIIGNKSASGTEILDELAEEEIATGHMIVYTSADSVLQICGNEETFGLEELYRCCEIARELTLKDEWKVGRVIARPYVGRKKGEFKRTSNRHDYALKPFGKTVLNVLKDAGYDVISVGKIFDIFDGEGITESNKSKSSVHGMEQTIEISKKDFTGLCFVNLVDFDALWGHRRNVEGYAKELESFDKKLGELLKCLKEDDLLIITADHGNDPTHTGTDHTREKVPFLAYSPSMRGSGKLEEGTSFANVGATIADNFNLEMPEGTIGNSYLEQFE